jgi:hypothetical protein
MQCVLTPDTEGYDQVLSFTHVVEVAIWYLHFFSYVWLVEIILTDDYNTFYFSMIIVR